MTGWGIICVVFVRWCHLKHRRECARSFCAAFFFNWLCIVPFLYPLLQLLIGFFLGLAATEGLIIDIARVLLLH